MAQTHYFPTDRVHFQWDTGNEPVLEIDERRHGHRRRPATSATTRSGRTRRPTSSPAWTGTASTRSPARSPSRRGAGRHARRRDPRPPHPRLGLDRDPARASASWPTTSPIRTCAIFDLSDGDFIHFRDDIAIPITPFFGTMGVCPEGASAQPVMPPGTFGGNMDTRQLTKGTTLFLPGPGAGRAVQLRRRARGPGRRRGLRDRPRVADVRGAALHRAEGAARSSRRSTRPGPGR